jgi:hypothetical protein
MRREKPIQKMEDEVRKRGGRLKVGGNLVLNLLSPGLSKKATCGCSYLLFPFDRRIVEVSWADIVRCTKYHLGLGMNVEV